MKYFLVKLTEEQRRVVTRALRGFQRDNAALVRSSIPRESIIASQIAEECMSALEALSAAQEVQG